MECHQSKYFPQKPQTVPERRVSEEPARPEGERVAPPKAVEPEKRVAPTVREIPKKQIVVETKNYVAVLTSDGARLKEFKLKGYLDRVDESAFVRKVKRFGSKPAWFEIKGGAGAEAGELGKHDGGRRPSSWVEFERDGWTGKKMEIGR